MSRAFTVTALTTRIRQAADVENDQHVTDTEILSLLNVYYPWFWDILIECAPPDYVSTTVTFLTVANQLSYVIDSAVAPAGDFYKLRHIYTVTTDGKSRPLKPVPESEVQLWSPVQTGGLTIKVLYIPSAPVLSSGSSVDGYNGWEELLVQRVAAQIKKKREEDPSPPMALVQELETRIRRMGQRDLDEPEHVVRRKYRNYWDIYYNSNNADGYRIRAGNLEIYSRTGYLFY